MRTFEYKTSRGVEITLTVSSIFSIKVKTIGSMGKIEAECKPSIIVGNGARVILFKKSIEIGSKDILGVEVTEEVERYILSLKREEEHKNMTAIGKAEDDVNEWNLPNITKVGVDMTTGLKRYTFFKKVNKEDFNKVRHLFSYFDVRCESNFKGYATFNPHEVCDILYPNWREEWGKAKAILEELREISEKNELKTLQEKIKRFDFYTEKPRRDFAYLL